MVVITMLPPPPHTHTHTHTTHTHTHTHTHRCCPALMSSQCCKSTCPTLTRSPTLSTHWRCWRCSKWTEKGRGRNTNHSQSSTTDSCSGTVPGRPTLWEYYLRYVVVLLCMHAQYLVILFTVMASNISHCLLCPRVFE